jgi:hypothetical protein
MKINRKLVEELIKKRDADISDYLHPNIYQKIAEAPGDNENIAIKYISNASGLQKLWFESMRTILYEKFPTEKMDAFLETTFPDSWYDSEVRERTKN